VITVGGTARNGFANHHINRSHGNMNGTRAGSTS